MSCLEFPADSHSPDQIKKPASGRGLLWQAERLQRNYETVKLADFWSFCSPASFIKITSNLYLPFGQPSGGGVKLYVAVPLPSRSRVFSRLGMGPACCPGTSSTTRRPFTLTLPGAFET